MRNLVLYTILSMYSYMIYAQQEPQYSQYMYNMGTVNPAYTKGERGLISTGLLYRKQWTGIDGAPETANAFANIPLNEKIALGINYVNDRIGEAIRINTNTANIDVAYITRISERFRLSYGLKVGISNLAIDPSRSDVANDPAFSSNSSTLDLTIGGGLFLFSHNFYAGVSSPNLLPSDASIGDIGVSESKTHIYGITGYVFNIFETVKLKPSVVIKQVIDAPITFDFSLNSLLYDRFELGVSYRYEDAFIVLTGFQITPSLKVGYAYDFSTSKLSGYNNGSHEIILLYNFDLLALGKKYTSPRFF